MPEDPPPPATLEAGGAFQRGDPLGPGWTGISSGSPFAPKRLKSNPGMRERVPASPGTQPA